MSVKEDRWTSWRVFDSVPKNERKGRGKRRNKIGKLRRQEIYERDGYRCVKCGNKSRKLTLDHKIPVSKGGTNATENLQTMCGGCNHAKGSKLPKS